MPIELTPKTMPYYETVSNVAKKYVAVISQTGSDAPTAIVLQNSIGDVIWSRLSAGIYELTLNGAFTTDKVAYTTGGFYGFYGIGYNNNRLRIDQYDPTETPADGWITNATIDITIYP